MLKSQLVALTTTAVPLTPPGTATDYSPGCSVLISNILSVDIKVGGADAQDLTVKAGKALPVYGLEPGEVLYAKTVSSSGNIELFWQGVTS